MDKNTLLLAVVKIKTVCPWQDKKPERGLIIPERRQTFWWSPDL